MFSPQARLLNVSIIVPTRNRPQHAAACAEAILASDGVLEVIFVDQSDDCATQGALSEIRDTRLRYVRTDTRGHTSGRNIGMALSRGDIIAFTDDDCRVRADWLQKIVLIFADDPAVAVVCGRVSVPKELQQLGWAESFEPHHREWQGRFPPIGEWGLCANLALRRAILPRVGMFDPLLGGGSPLRSGGEPDFLFRVLRAGLKVVNASEVIADHLGIRRHGADSRELIVGYGIGTAAAFIKHVRSGDFVAAAVYCRFLGTTLFRVGRNVIQRRRPTGGRFLMAFVAGAFASFRFRVDSQRQYVER
jgi:glycosyltransferase involved in cell wall biosynthesis